MTGIGRRGSKTYIREREDRKKSCTPKHDTDRSGRMWSVTERGREARVIFFGENIHESDEDKDIEKDSNRQRERER